MNIPVMSIKKAKQLRLLFFLLFLLVDIIAPVIIIGVKFKLFTQFNGYKLTLIGLFISILLLLKFRKKLIEYVEKWEYSILKYIILGINKIMVFILLSIVAHLAVRGLSDIIYCVDWILVTSAIAYLGIQPFEEKYDYIVKRELRKNELREVLKEERVI